jgi:hypothetical protein
MQIMYFHIYQNIESNSGSNSKISKYFNTIFAKAEGL